MCKFFICKQTFNKENKTIKYLCFLLIFGYTPAYAATDCVVQGDTSQTQCEALSGFV
ncbi:hypothetical protein QUF74_03030 [Candidatus Halobeggiatoa sp. HSG11]|nr:hypothetical protein [Candidatus Halobeggiatoa sp. HSG11]